MLFFSLKKKRMPISVVATTIPFFLLRYAQSDTPQACIKLGPWAGELKVGPGMNAAGRNLRGSEFVGQGLRGALFEGSDLHGVRFWDCDLSAASFKRAHLTDVFFYECRELEGTDFTDAVIAGLRVDSVAYLSPEQLMSTRSYKTKDLRGCTISAYVRRRPNARPAYDFRGANLEGATLVHGDFSACDFTDARIDRIQIRSCTMTFEQLASTKNFKDRSLRDMKISVVLQGDPDFSGIDLTGTQLGIGRGRHASFNNAIISGCTVGSAMFRKQDLYATQNYKQGNLSKITFHHVDMSGWDLSRQNLTRCRFAACIFAGANFEDAVITGVYVTDGLGRTKGLTVKQIKSTWNYKHGRMAGIVLPKEIREALRNSAD